MLMQLATATTASVVLQGVWILCGSCSKQNTAQRVLIQTSCQSWQTKILIKQIKQQNNGIPAGLYLTQCRAPLLWSCDTDRCSCAVPGCGTTLAKMYWRNMSHPGWLIQQKYSATDDRWGQHPRYVDISSVHGKQQLSKFRKSVIIMCHWGDKSETMHRWPGENLPCPSAQNLDRQYCGRCFHQSLQAMPARQLLWDSWDSLCSSFC